MPSTFSYDSNSRSLRQRPSTGLNMSAIVIDQDDELACPSPFVRSRHRDESRSRSELRFTRPTPFQESKNFWKTRELAILQRHSRSVQSSSSAKRHHTIICTKPRLSIDSTRPRRSTYEADDDAVSAISSEGLCRSSPIPSWPHLRHARYRHSSPVLRDSSVVSSQKRATTRATSSPESWISPRRAVMPKRVKSRGRLSFLRSTDNASDPHPDLDGVGRNEILVKMEVEVYNEMPLPGEDPVQERAASALSMWNDPDEQHRFAASWRGHQEGTLSRDTFLGRLAFEGTPEGKQSGSRATGTQMSDLDPGARPRSRPLTKSPSGMVAPIPPERKSSRDQSKAQPMPLPIPRARSQQELQGILEEQVLDQLQMSTTPQRPFRLAASTNLAKARPHNDLKNARSVESLSQIEAMIPKTSPEPAVTLDVPVLTPKKSPGRMRHPSRGSCPSGQPPERPLPDLPVENEEIGLAIKSNISDIPEVISNGTNIIENNGVSVPTACRDVATEESTRLASLSGPRRSPSVAAHTSPCQQESPSLARWMPRQNKLTLNRSERIRELKRKHVAAVARARAAASEELIEVEEAAALYDKPFERFSLQSCDTKSVAEFPHPPPPLPPSRYHVSPSTARRNAMDELDQFPAVPFSRPASRASVVPVTGSGRGVTRTNSSPRTSRSRARTIHGRQSSGYPDTKQLGKQVLSLSLIYVNLDTDPRTSGFHTSTVNANTSKNDWPGQPTSFALEAKDALRSSSAAVTPQPLVRRKQSSRSLRSQTSVARSMVRHGLERVSPATFSRPGSRHNHGLLSSEDDDKDRNDESDQGGFFSKRTPLARPTSKASSRSRTSRRRRESGVPELPMTGQYAMEHVLMALAKCQNQGVDINHLSPQDVEKLAYQQKVEDELDSRAAKRLSMAHRPRRPYSGRFDDQRKLLELKPKLPRPCSDVSVMTMAGTDTDASANSAPSDGFSSPGKRGSGGSLTDPTDYEMYDVQAIPEPTQAARNMDNVRLIRTRRRPSSPTLSSKPYTYYQVQINLAHSKDGGKRGSRLHLPPPVAPPRTTSRAHSDRLRSSPSMVSQAATEMAIGTFGEGLDLDDTGTSDPFMLGMLDGMAKWTNPMVNEGGWHTWGDEERVIEGKALFSPPLSTAASICL